MKISIKKILSLQVFILSFFIFLSLERLTSSSAAELLQSAIKGALFISFAITGVLFGAKTIKELTTNISIPFTAYLIICFISLIWSSAPSATSSAFIGLISITLGAVAVRKYIPLKELIRLIVMSAEIIVLFSLGWSYYSDSAYEMLQLKYRLAGVTHGPHALALAAALVIFYHVYLLKEITIRKQLTQTILSMLIITFSAYAIILADSRQIMLGLFIPIFYFLLTSKTGGLVFRAFKFTIFTLLLVTSILYLYLDNIGARSLETFARSDISEIYTFTGRTVIWQSVINLIYESPFLGYGYGAGGAVLSNFYSTDFGWTTSSSHNALLHSMLDVGIIGAPFIIFWFLTLFHKSIILRNEFISCLMGLTFIVMFVERMYTGAVGTNLFILVLISPYVFNHFDVANTMLKR